MARGLKLRIAVVEGLYYPYSENKGADQLRGYREADLRLCFRICKKPVFSQRGSYSRMLRRMYLTWGGGGGGGGAIKNFLSLHPIGLL